MSSGLFVVRCPASSHHRGAFFDELEVMPVFPVGCLSFVPVLICGQALLRPNYGVICIFID